MILFLRFGLLKKERKVLRRYFYSKGVRVKLEEVSLQSGFNDMAEYYRELVKKRLRLF